MIRILLVDDHVLFRQGLRVLLKGTPEIEIIGEASSGAEGVRLARDLKANVVLLDIQLPDMSGLEVTRRLLRIPFAPKILVLSASHHQEFSRRSLETGALGYVNKDASIEELITAIKTVNKGQHFLSAVIANTLAMAKLNYATHPILSKLNSKEIEIFLATIRGISSAEIGKQLHMSSKTVHSYRSRLFRKLNVENNVGLVLTAIREGLVAIEETEG